MNFGSKPTAYPLRPGYEMIDFCDKLQPAVKSGESAEDYEWNMFVGLPAAGKSEGVGDVFQPILTYKIFIFNSASPPASQTAII